MTRVHRPLPSTFWLAITSFLSLIVAIVLGLVAHGPNVLGWDVDVTSTVQQVQGTPAPALADLGNLLGSTMWAALAIVLGIAGAAILRLRAELVFLATLLALRLLATQLKPLFASPRPTDDLVTIVGEWHGSGYPSGHALTASTMALGLAIIAWRRIPSRRVAIATIALLIVLALIVGWARIWSGAHWTSDVLGGYAFGTAIVALSAIPYRWFDPKTTN